MQESIPPYFETHELTHKFAGNGLFYLDAPDGVFVRVIAFEVRGMRTYVARISCLSKFASMPIKPEIKAQIDKLRSDLLAGERHISNGYVCEGEGAAARIASENPKPTNL